MPRLNLSFLSVRTWVVVGVTAVLIATFAILSIVQSQLKSESDSAKAFPTSRNMQKWPFGPQSIWNMPIGSGAVYKPAGLDVYNKTGRKAGPDVWDPDQNFVIFTKNSDPMVKIKKKTGWNGSILPDQIHFPSGITNRGCGYNSSGNGLLMIILPDGVTHLQMNAWCFNGAGELEYNDANNAFQYTRLDSNSNETSDQPFKYKSAGYPDSLNSSVVGAHGAAYMAGMGGMLRIGELASPEDIHHALQINIDAKVMQGCNNSWKGYRWPSVKADSYACGGGTHGYSGLVPGVGMGSLLALHSNVNIASMGLKTAAGLKLAKAFQDYGSYVVDDIYYNAISINFENDGHGVTPSKEVGGQLADKAVNPLTDDIKKIFDALQLVDNNDANNIGGGGTRRQPLAPAFGSVPTASVSSTSISSLSSPSSSPPTSTSSSKSTPTSSSTGTVLSGWKLATAFMTTDPYSTSTTDITRVKSPANSTDSNRLVFKSGLAPSASVPPGSKIIGALLEAVVDTASTVDTTLSIKSILNSSKSGYTPVGAQTYSTATRVYNIARPVLAESRVQINITNVVDEWYKQNGDLNTDFGLDIKASTFAKPVSFYGKYDATRRYKQPKVYIIYQTIGVTSSSSNIGSSISSLKSLTSSSSTSISSTTTGTRPVKIMQVGDSVTEGNASRGTQPWDTGAPYLAKYIAQNSNQYQMVGDVTTNSKTNNVKVEAHGGWCIVAKNGCNGIIDGTSANRPITQAISEFKPDIVTILYGTNDHGAGWTDQEIANNFVTLVSKFYQNGQNPYVYVSTTKYLGNVAGTGYTYTPLVKAAIEKLNNPRVTYSEPYSGFTAADYAYANTVHLSTQGAQKMGQNWFNIIKSKLILF